MLFARYLFIVHWTSGRARSASLEGLSRSDPFFEMFWDFSRCNLDESYGSFQAISTTAAISSSHIFSTNAENHCKVFYTRIDSTNFEKLMTLVVQWVDLDHNPR